MVKTVMNRKYVVAKCNINAVLDFVKISVHFIASSSTYIEVWNF
jgi:hypothetical protein